MMQDQEDPKNSRFLYSCSLLNEESSWTFCWNRQLQTMRLYLR